MTVSRCTYILAALLAATLLVPTGVSTALAQQIPQSEFLTPNVKEYGRPGYPMMTIYVWGNADTGVWNVEEGTDLLEFLSVVSRVQFGENRPDQRATEILRLYRDGRAEGEPFFESRVEDLFTRRDSYPTLQEGDIIVLETKVKGRFTWRDVGQVVGVAATVLNTWLLLDRLRNE